VLFLDEPTAGLDPQARTAMWAEISRLAADEELAILLTTHHLEEADRLAQRVSIVDRGRVVVTGTPDQLKAELRGDAVHIELRDDPADGSAARALEMVSGVREITVTGRRLSALATRVPDIADPALVAAAPHRTAWASARDLGAGRGRARRRASVASVVVASVVAVVLVLAVDFSRNWVRHAIGARC